MARRTGGSWLEARTTPNPPPQVQREQHQTSILPFFPHTHRHTRHILHLALFNCLTASNSFWVRRSATANRKWVRRFPEQVRHSQSPPALGLACPTVCCECADPHNFRADKIQNFFSAQQPQRASHSPHPTACAKCVDSVRTRRPRGTI